MLDPDRSACHHLGGQRRPACRQQVAGGRRPGGQHHLRAVRRRWRPIALPGCLARSAPAATVHHPVGRQHGQCRQLCRELQRAGPQAIAISNVVVAEAQPPKNGILESDERLVITWTLTVQPRDHSASKSLLASTVKRSPSFTARTDRNATLWRVRSAGRRHTQLRHPGN